ncbi:GyrI-like domain-containing protein [Cognatishimia maritima]|uniref:Effector-binding domain-containing protein n=1 Tax=Cognatishimia maritima TaxID=870908 RepID=A0A1M5UYP5_9RHOB|nr:GyrI-like domain-containing protein [Cognatishimia maritima]SHH68125.1 effector-binding domain-containing protein [Cognatishimia maritima]
MDISEKSFDAQDYLYVAGEAALMDGKAIADAMGAAFGTAFGFLGSAGIEPLSAPISVYTEMPGKKMTFRCGFFVSPEDAAKASGDVSADVIPATKALHALHVGPYMNMNQTHGAIWAHAKAKGLTSAMPVWEIYIDDPQKTAPEELRTEIYHSLG